MPPREVLVWGRFNLASWTQGRMRIDNRLDVHVKYKYSTEGDIQPGKSVSFRRTHGHTAFVAFGDKEVRLGHGVCVENHFTVQYEEGGCTSSGQSVL